MKGLFTRSWARPGDDRASGQGEDAFLLPVLQPDADDGAGQEGMISTKGKNDGENRDEVKLIKTGKVNL